MSECRRTELHHYNPDLSTIEEIRERFKPYNGEIFFHEDYLKGCLLILKLDFGQGPFFRYVTTETLHRYQVVDSNNLLSIWTEVERWKNGITNQ